MSSETQNGINSSIDISESNVAVGKDMINIGAIYTKINVDKPEKPRSTEDAKQISELLIAHRKQLLARKRDFEDLAYRKGDNATIAEKVTSLKNLLIQFKNVEVFVNTLNKVDPQIVHISEDYLDRDTIVNLWQNGLQKKQKDDIERQQNHIEKQKKDQVNNYLMWGFGIIMFICVLATCNPSG